MSNSGASTGQPSKEKFTIRSLIWSVYAPSFLLAFGQGLLIPVLPVYARDEFDATPLLIGVVVGARHFGTMGFDVPAGILVGRLGLRKTMIIGVVLFGVAAVIAGISPNLTVLITGRVLAGVSFALWSLSRHVYIAQTVPVASRGKALSLFGGISRIATILGPLVGGILATYAGQSVPFFLQAGVAALTMVLVLYTFRGTVESTANKAKHNVFPTLGNVLYDYRAIFATAGLAAVILQFMRAAREFVIPVKGDDIGLDEAEIGFIVAISSTVDSLLFPVVGYVMDRWGRKHAGVPAYLILAAALALIPVANTYSLLMLVGVLAGLGNGLSSGLVLTLGSDFAPRDNPGEFLGVWRFISDGGGASGPLAIGGLTQLFTLGTASVLTAGLGGVGALVLVTLVKETLVKREKT